MGLNLGVPASKLQRKCSRPETQGVRIELSDHKELFFIIPAGSIYTVLVVEV